MKTDLLKELFSLWDSLAECGELHIGPQFSAQYKRLKIDVQMEILNAEESVLRRRANHKKWRDKKESKAKISEYNKAYSKKREMERRRSEADQVKKELV